MTSTVPPPVQAALQELKQYLRLLYGPRFDQLYLYGSYARGDFHAGSDVDVMVTLTGEVNPYQE